MATQAQVRRIAMALPGTEEIPGRFGFAVRDRDKLKGYAWVWLERVHPKQARVPQPKVLAIRVASLDDKEFLLGLDPGRFFTEPHYNGYPAVLVRLPAVTVGELRPLLLEAWRCQAPKALRAAMEARAPRRASRTAAPPRRQGTRGG
ncbi:MAG: hypothetical protein IPL76_18530 [Gemmatimonadetes bacterium]|nr:hypothetical protein [Gemmatimonadota bacterium]